MTIKTGLMAWSMVLASAALVFTPFDAEAKRLGSNRPAGMQRSMPDKAPTAPTQQATPGAPANQAVPGKPAQQNQAGAPNAAAAAQQAAPKRSWMGPIAGLAAGLGLAALASHFGFGDELANFMMMALLAVGVMLLVGFLMRRFANKGQAAGPQLAGAGAPFSQGHGQQQPMQRESFNGFQGGASASPVGAMGAAEPVQAAGALPDGFDTAGFERVAKMIFIRMQAANDEANVDDLRKFTTPELFSSLKADLLERGGAQQQTDVMQLDAQVVDAAQEQGQWVVSVRFAGLIREEVGAGAEPFAELWHLVRPLDESREWAIAGITPLQG
ncbi:Tim44 domain-containing protein [Aquabacterium lacunae]|jgi:predicted lipid-binding transport protein (Tim44 family)|uniref:Tim44 domain-containing protein n=1 Tax=Aquabacterium lacunae TaxID=2528630 RepID=UPI0013EF4A31|nr:TIM44-like domain-containing protein [Aquabacterium lacunae]